MVHFHKRNIPTNITTQYEICPKQYDQLVIQAKMHTTPDNFLDENVIRLRISIN